MEMWGMDSYLHGIQIRTLPALHGGRMPVPDGRMKQHLDSRCYASEAKQAAIRRRYRLTAQALSSCFFADPLAVHAPLRLMAAHRQATTSPTEQPSTPT